MGEKKKEPSYNCLKESLRCANAEARGYLDRLAPLQQERDEVAKELMMYKEAFAKQKRIVDALLDLAEAKRGTKS